MDNVMLKDVDTRTFLIAMQTSKTLAEVLNKINTMPGVKPFKNLSALRAKAKYTHKQLGDEFIQPDRLSDWKGKKGKKALKSQKATLPKLSDTLAKLNETVGKGNATTTPIK